MIATPAVILSIDSLLQGFVTPNNPRAGTGAIDRAAPMLSSLGVSGFLVVVITYQPDVARGVLSAEKLEVARRRLAESLSCAGVDLSGFLYCPHHPSGRVVGLSFPCTCRKPAPGLIHQATRELTIDIERSWLIGETLDDVEAGRRAGCHCVLVDTGVETEWRLAPERRPQLWASSVEEAGELIYQKSCIGADRPLLFRPRIRASQASTLFRNSSAGGMERRSS